MRFLRTALLSTGLLLVGATGAMAAGPSPLRLADMPSGWTQEPVSANKPGACGFYLGHPLKSEFKEGGSLGDQATSSAKAFKTVTIARRIMTFNLQKAPSCHMDGNTIKLMSFPKIGDQSFAVKLTASKYGVDVTAFNVFFRKGSRVGAITVVSIGSGNVYQFESFARKGLRRLGSS